MGNDKSDFSNEIWKVLDSLTGLMDQMEEERKRRGNLEMKRCLNVLAKAQGQLLKAVCAFDPSYRIPPEGHESWDHFLAKNYLIKEIAAENFSAEFGLGGCVVDVLAKIGEECVIIEAETDYSKCVEKARKIKAALGNLVSDRRETFETVTYSEIRNELEGGPMRLIFVVIGKRKPSPPTLKDIKKEQDDLISPEVYFVNRNPPFEKSSNLLEKIQICEVISG